jgi:uncharacterized protein
MKERNTLVKMGLMLCLAAFVPGGCGGVTPSVSYYTLNMLPRVVGETRTSSDITVAMGSVGIPEVLDRPQIVTRTNENRVQISEFHRWAGSLKDDLTRVLMENLNTLLAADGVTVRMMDTAVDPAYRLSVSVNQLEGALGGKVRLSAVWTIRGQGAKPMFVADETLLEEKVTGEDYDSFVAAQSRLIATLSKEIAHAIRGLRKAAP